MNDECVDLDVNWFWVECPGCGAEWRNDELRFVPSDIGPGVFECRCCGAVVGVEDGTEG